MPSDLNEQALELYLNNPYEFIGIMHLDLMNPLGAIHGAAGLLSDLIEDEELDKERLSEVIHIIIHQTRLLRSVFDELPEYEKIRRARNLPKSPD